MNEYGFWGSRLCYCRMYWYLSLNLVNHFLALKWVLHWWKSGNWKSFNYDFLLPKGLIDSFFPHVIQLVYNLLFLLPFAAKLKILLSNVLNYHPFLNLCMYPSVFLGSQMSGIGKWAFFDSLGYQPHDPSPLIQSSVFFLQNSRFLIPLTWKYQLAGDCGSV